MPGEDLEALAGEFVAEAGAAGCGAEGAPPRGGVHLSGSSACRRLRPEAEGAAEALARRLTGANAAGVVSYGTEAGQFQQAGYSAVVCGPGDIAQAHQADEYLEVSEFEAGQRFMERLLEDLA